MSIEKTLNEIYNNPSSGFSSARKFYLKAKKINPKIKTKDVQSQVTLNANERAKILFNTFSINEDSPVNTNSRILLVDDLITTGATLESCAKTLNNAAYHHLSIAAIAITDNT